MFWRKKRSLEDFKAEIESHLAHEADQLRGRVPEPESEARRTFGNITAVEESRYEYGRWMWFDHFRRDLKQGFRQIRTKPGFSAVVILTLALGIGANSSIFSILNAVLLRPLPYQNPNRLVMVFSADPARDLHQGGVSLLNFLDWQRKTVTFEDMALFSGQTFLLGSADGSAAPERLRSARVPANFWNVLGAEPLLGRLFTADEERQAEPVAVLSFRLWQQRFGGARDALGKMISIDGRSYRVIGVMREQFQFPYQDTSLWEPLTAHPYWTTRDQKLPRQSTLWRVVGRLKTGITAAQAQQEMSGIAEQLRAQYPASQLPPKVEIVPLDVQATGRFRLSLWLLFGAVMLMLMIACINVTSLLLARGASRSRELALRRALGAGRVRVAVQLTTEALVLSACGGLLGLLFASSATAALVRFGPAEIPRLAEARIDWQVALFTAVLSVLAAVIASFWPALDNSTKEAGSRQWTTASTRRTRDVLVVGEFALALILVTGAGLLVHSFVRLRDVELGFRPDHLLMMRVDLHVGRTNEQQAAYFEGAIARVRALPGVETAAAVSGFLRTDPEDGVELEDRAEPLHPGPCDDQIAGAFFQTAGIPLKKGRYFTIDDRRTSLPVAIVNETMVRAYWPNVDPIGKRFRFDQKSPWLTVVGVTGDMRRQGLERQIAPQVFRPRSQGNDDMMELIVRTTGEPVVLIPTIQKEIEAMDPTVARFRIATVNERLSDQMAERKFDTFLLGTFSLAALLLSAVGIYGLLQYAVAQRTNEIGVRMALGARPGAVVGMVLSDGILLALVGVAVGVVGSLALTRLLSGLLFETAPTDPMVLLEATFLLLGVAALGCAFPAWRASRIDPMLALRQD